MRKMMMLAPRETVGWTSPRIPSLRKANLTVKEMLSRAVLMGMAAASAATPKSGGVGWTSLRPPTLLDLSAMAKIGEITFRVPTARDALPVRMTMLRRSRVLMTPREAAMRTLVAPRPLRALLALR